jgi:AcrR family transcriptional regulator
MSPRGKETSELLLDVAELRFGELGYEETKLRDIVDRAGVNLSAIKYHFGSKDGLLRAVMTRAMAPVNAERDRRLSELEDLPTPPTVEQLVRAFVEPGLRLTETHGARGPTIARLLGGVLFESNPQVRQIVADETAAIGDRYLAGLCRALPTLTPAAMLSGYTAMVGLLAQHQAGISAQLHRRGVLIGAEPEGTQEETLIRFIVAGFTQGLTTGIEHQP